MRSPAAPLRIAHDGVGPLSVDDSSPFILGVTGHRDLADDAVARLHAEVAGLFRQLGERLPDTPLRVVVGMAAGADLLVAEAALDAGAQVEALLPMSLDDYATDFSATDLARLRALLAQPRVSTQQLAAAPTPEMRPPAGATSWRDTAYGALADEMVRRASLLVALWDGLPATLPAGTADTVLRFLAIRRDPEAAATPLQFRPASTEAESGEPLVYWIPAPRSGATTTAGPGRPCWLRGRGDGVLEWQVETPGHFAAELSMLDHYNRDFRQRREAGEIRLGASLLGGLPAGTPVADDPALARLDAQYLKADALAMYYQRHSDRLFQVFGVMAFSMGLAYLGYEKLADSRVLLTAYLAILLGSLGIYSLFERRRWFAKHLSYRALAETLRVKFYMRLAGTEQQVDEFEVLRLSGIDRFRGFSWISHVLAGAHPVATCSEPVAAALRAACVQPAWIDNQHGYFERKVAQLERSSRRVHRLRRGLFLLILVVIVTLFLFGEWLHGHDLGLGVPLHNLLTFCTGFFAVLLGVWELHQNKMATRELLWQYRNQLAHFARARERLAGGLLQRAEAVAELGKDSLMEGYLWTIHRYHREHEPPNAT